MIRFIYCSEGIVAAEGVDTEKAEFVGFLEIEGSGWKLTRWVDG